MNGDTETHTTTKPGRPLTTTKASSLLWNTLWDALTPAFMILVLGVVAYALVGNIWGRMLPTLPSGSGAATGVKSVSNPNWHFGAVERFMVTYGVVFAVMATGRLLRRSQNPRQRVAGVWLNRATERAAEEWFQLLVINAFVASIMVSVLQVTNQFTPLKMLWQALAAVLQPPLQAMVSLLPAGPTGAARDLWGWLDANQLKFSFWLFYLGAICDDLGLPNYKALGRWAWRRLKKKHRPVVTKEATETSASVASEKNP